MQHRVNAIYPLIVLTSLLYLTFIPIAIKLSGLFMPARGHICNTYSGTIQAHTAISVQKSLSGLSMIYQDHRFSYSTFLNKNRSQPGASGLSLLPLA